VIPRIIAAGEAVPANALVVDCGLSGGAATYSHWQAAAPCPPELVADTSTGMVVHAALDPQRWLNGFSFACTDHIDADGALALAVACRPDLARDHAAMMVSAAEAGDFQSWPNVAGFRLLLLIHRLLRDEQAAGTMWQQRAATAVVERFAELLTSAVRPDDELDRAIAQATDVRHRLTTQTGFACEILGDLVSIAWQRHLGHAWDQFGDVYRADDLPLWSLGGMFPDTTFQLCAERHDQGTTYVLDAPRHSWARTVQRPTVAWPDLTRAQLRLTGLEQGRCQWVVRPAAQRIGFVCQLASVDAQGQPTGSGLPLPTVASAIREALRLRPRR